MDRWLRTVEVGNAYVNRNQIGAVVGVQPFGGEGLSGTGPKAGGPHYLFRFAVEFVRGSGVHLYDTEGKAYLDFVSGIAVNALAAGGTGFLSYIARDPQARSITFWMAPKLMGRCKTEWQKQQNSRSQH